MLQELIAKEVKLSEAREELIVSHKKAINELEGQLQKVRENILLSAANYDLDKIALAEAVICVQGNASGEERIKTIRKAVEDLAINKAGELKTKYFGVKNYAHFGDQGCDCSYGMGPRHGSIVFRVELNRDKRDSELSPKEIDAAIFYLQNIKDIQAKIKAA